ncbi:uncharacterized protein LOC110414443 [Herrania umbratica]|uniref:Uncharacterized protein LOC110414443 n=1 Tax=Herrania umbratica TaxID=108875 RepID=A0A6J1A3H2_9ROSI|nr:uncharacterized protein LOC110414443 [Herrania umbratica]XP_021281311.1 uncharacterized protein LOC110414443 [Herrania umbratica]
MAGATKLQQSLQESYVLRIPKTEIDVKIEDNAPAPPAPPAPPVPPVSPERPDVWTEWRQQRWKSTLSKEELKQCCLRCKEIGHNYQHCPYPIIYVEVQDENGGPGWVKPVVWQPPKGIYRCSRCGRRGHNRRTCHGPVFY